MAFTFPKKSVLCVDLKNRMCVSVNSPVFLMVYVQLCVCLWGARINGIFLFIALQCGVSHAQHAEQQMVYKAGRHRVTRCEQETLECIIIFMKCLLHDLCRASHSLVFILAVHFSRKQLHIWKKILHSIKKYRPTILIISLINAINFINLSISYRLSFICLQRLR